jgi:DNA-binding transcriptional MerR regulator
MEVTRARHYLVTEVCRRLGIKPHILRYWEREFDIKPVRNSAGRRIYNEAQLERLQLVKHLVRTEKLTVAGARRQLSKMSAQPTASEASDDHRQALLWLKKELLSLRTAINEQSPDDK